MISHSKNLRKSFLSGCFFVAVLLVIQGIGNPRADASPAKDEDFGIWNTYDVEKKLNAQWKIMAGEELRFREHNGIYYTETHVATNYQPSKYLALGALYLENRASRTKKNDEIWYWESEPRIYMTPQLPFKGFLLENRNMLAFRWRQESKFAMVYRNLTTLTAPWKWTRFELQPYTANEIFLETNRNGMFEDRFYSGLKAHWWGPFYGTIFYLRQFKKDAVGKWTSLNILGTSLKISF
ncbi:MAG: DUF2490 domain-containing protein [Candidatus Omnitrophota bacterium]